MSENSFCIFNGKYIEFKGILLMHVIIENFHETKNADHSNFGLTIPIIVPPPAQNFPVETLCTNLKLANILAVIN